jgi:hypothetical protein
VASAAVVTRSIKLMQFSTMYQLIRWFPWWSSGQVFLRSGPLIIFAT